MADAAFDLDSTIRRAVKKRRAGENLALDSLQRKRKPKPKPRPPQSQQSEPDEDDNKEDRDDDQSASNGDKALRQSARDAMRA